MVAQAAKEREEAGRLSYVPVLTRALTEAERAAYTIMSDAWRNMFGGRVKDSRIGELVSDPMNFEGATVKYARIGDEEIYSVEATLNRRKSILTLRAGANSTEMLLQDMGGREIEYLRESGGEIRVKRA